MKEEMIIFIKKLISVLIMFGLLCCSLCGCAHSKEQIEEIHTASFADDGCLLFDDEHYELRHITQELAQDSMVASFTTQTAIEGIVWNVFTIKEYPNKEYLLLMSGTNANWLCCLGCPQSA